MKNTYFYTQGCRLNQSETASLENAFKNEGFTIVTEAHQANIAIINTCTVTENSDSDTRRLVNKLTNHNPDMKIALIGCQSQVHKNTLLKLKNVKWVIGTAEKMNTHHIISQTLECDDKVCQTEKIQRTPLKFQVLVLIIITQEQISKFKMVVIFIVHFASFHLQEDQQEVGYMKILLESVSH